jgi:parvulin-like peptidyl-prolyl cis-trans isomerase-like protein
MRLRRALAVLAVAAAISMGTVGCGGLASGAMVVHVGDVSISRLTVDHWTGVIERKGGFTGRRGEPSGAPKQRALALLITSNWLIQEATRQGVSVSEDAVHRALMERERENGELLEWCHRVGQTIADVKFELKAELAAELLRAKLAKRAERITPQEVADFYWTHRSLVDTGIRVTDLIEGQSSPAAAIHAAPLLGTTQQYGSQAIREQVKRTGLFLRSPEKVRVVDEIFAARPGVISHPVLINKSWALFVVRKVIPGHVTPFAQAREEALVRVGEQRQQAVASSFEHDYRAYWKAHTSCRRDYVGPGCPQFARPLGAYEDPISTKVQGGLAEPFNWFFNQPAP